MPSDHIKKEHKPSTGVHSSSAGSSKPGPSHSQSNNSRKKPTQRLSKKTKSKNRKRGVQKAIKTKARNKRRLERDREQAEVVRQVNPEYEGPLERKTRLRKEFLARRREIKRVNEERIAVAAECKQKIREKKKARKKTQIEERYVNGQAGPSTPPLGQSETHPIEVDMDEEEERVENGPRPPSDPDMMTPYVPLPANGSIPITSAGPPTTANEQSHSQWGDGTGQKTPNHQTAPQGQSMVSSSVQAEAGPSTPRIYHVSYPKGGVTSQKKKKGIFADPEKDRKLRVWVDPVLRDRTSMLQKIKDEHGRISADHTEKATQLIILSPRSTYLFDMYCHPDWLCAEDRERFRRRQSKLRRLGEEEEPWQRKVLLKDMWISRCFDAGRFLGEADNWGGCRAGGPPVGVLTSTEQQPKGTQADGDDEGEDEDGEEEYWTEDDEDEEDEDEDEEMFSDEEYPEEDEAPVEDDSPAVRPTQDEPDKSADADLLQVKQNGNENVQSIPTRDAAPPAPVLIGVKATMNGDSHSGVVPITTSMTPLANADIMVFNEPLGLQTPVTGVSITSPVQGGPEPAQAASNLGQNQDSQANNDPAWAMEIEGDGDDAGYALQGIADENAVMEEEVDPKTMFRGLKFWLDPSFPDRLPLIRRLRGAGAELSTDYSESTHVLVHGYKANLWHGIVTNLAPKGIWFVTVNWVIKSLDAGRKLPEESYVVPGGNAHASAVEVDRKPHIHKAGSLGGEAYMSPEDLAGIFERESKMLEHGGTLKAMCAFLVSKYGTYADGYWRTLYTQWTRREERFAHLQTGSQRRRVSRDESIGSRSPSIVSFTPASASASTSVHGKSLSGEVVRQAIETAVEASPQMPRTDLSQLLHEKHPEYTKGDWNRNIGYWMNRSGRFSGLNPHPASLTSAKVFESAAFNAPNWTMPTASQPTKKRPGPAYNTEELEKIFTEEIPKMRALGIISYSQIGKRLASKYPGLHSSTWSIMYSEWMKKTGQFSPTRAQTSSSSNRELMSTEDLAFTFLLHEDNFIDQELDRESIGAKLADLYGVYDAETWSDMWNAWVKGKGGFAKLESGARPKRAQPHGVAGRPSRASRSIASSTPSLASENTGSSSKASSNPTKAKGKCKGELLTSEDLGLIFKEREGSFADEKLSRQAIGFRLAQDVGIYAAGTWSNFYGDWSRGAGRFARLDHSLKSINAGGYPPISPELTDAGSTSTAAQTSVPSTSRIPAETATQPTAPAPGASSSSQTSSNQAATNPSGPILKIKLKDLPSPGNHAKDFTFDEEMEMAKYIAVYPGPYKKSAIAWMDFAEKHPKRTAYVYAKLYSTNQTRIDSYAEQPQAGSTVSASFTPKKQSAGGVLSPMAGPSGSGSVTRLTRAATAPHPAASGVRPARPVRAVRGSQEMPVEVGLDDDDDDEDEDEDAEGEDDTEEGWYPYSKRALVDGDDQTDETYIPGQ
ncbi:hypothetical protein IAU59_002894 [Kwoniella sp. CBS 9459]